MFHKMIFKCHLKCRVELHWPYQIVTRSSWACFKLILVFPVHFHYKIKTFETSSMSPKNFFSYYCLAIEFLTLNFHCLFPKFLNSLCFPRLELSFYHFRWSPRFALWSGNPAGPLENDKDHQLLS